MTLGQYGLVAPLSALSGSITGHLHQLPDRCARTKPDEYSSGTPVRLAAIFEPYQE